MTQAYFSHDSNAKDDPKCVLLIEELGLEGYGIFWVLVEELRNQPNYKYPLKLVPALARRYNTTTPKVEVVIKNYGLFELDKKDFFFSRSLNFRMQKMEEKSKTYSQNAKIGVQKKREKAQKHEALLLELIEQDSTKQSLNNSTATAEQSQSNKTKLKETKTKEKEKEINSLLERSFTNLIHFKKWVVENLEGYTFTTQGVGWQEDTEFQIKGGYIYSNFSNNYLDNKDALKVWQYLFSRQNELLEQAETQC